MAKYATIIRFNGRIERSALAKTYEAESVHEALDLACADAVRSNAGGGSVFVTGVTVEKLD